MKFEDIAKIFIREALKQTKKVQQSSVWSQKFKALLV